MIAATTAVAVSPAAVFGAIGVIVLYNIIGLLINGKGAVVVKRERK